jgi:hypothetical protein
MAGQRSHRGADAGTAGVSAGAVDAVLGGGAVRATAGAPVLGGIKSGPFWPQPVSDKNAAAIAAAASPCNENDRTARPRIWAELNDDNMMGL